MHPLVKPFEECGLQRHSELHLAEQPASLASLFPAPPAFHPAYARDRHNSLDRDDRGDHGVRAVPNHPSGRDAGVPLRSHDGGDGDRHAAPKLDVNTNGSVYSQLFWLNPLLPKDHLNFLGYHEGIGPVCVSTLPSGESGWFHAFVRTPLRFALVQVPVTRLEGPEARALQRFLPPKAPHKLLLYFVMEAYFQQVDVGHVHYVRWKQEVERTAGPRPLPPLLPSIAESAGPAVLDLLGDSSFADDSADVSPSPPPQTLPPGERDLTAAVATLPAAPAPAPRTASAPAVITSPAKSVGWTLANPFDESVATSDVPSSTATLCDLLNETTFRPPSPSKAFNRSSMTARDLIDLVLAVEPLNGESLKPALRNLEPRLIRRYHEIDVLVGPREAHSASHLQFQRFLQVLGQPFNYQQLWATIPRTNTIPGSASSAPGSSSSGYGSAGGPTPPGGHPMDPLEETLYRPLKARSAAGMAERRQSILQELIYTERSYVQKLQALITVYVVPLRSASRSGKSQLIPPYMANAIFTNVEQLAAVNEAFLQDLERYESEAQCSRTGGGRSDPAGADEATPDAAQTGAGWLDDGPSLGQICYQHLCNFDVYKRYINGYQHALECSSQLEKKNESYRHFLARSRDHPSCHKLGISDLLVMPVQRIPRYTLLLTDLLKNTPVNHLDYADLQRALDRGHEIGHLADNQVADTLTELHTIHGHVAECPASLISASRRLLISIDATELDFSTSTILKHITLYLFTDRIMVVERPPHVTSSQSTSKKKVYKFLTWIELGAVEVLETVGPGSANRFYIQCHAAPCLDPYWETKPLHAYSVSGTNDRQRWVQRFYAAHALRRSALLHAEADGPSTGLPGTGSDLAAGSTTATTTAAAATTTTTTTTGSSLVTAATLASGNPPAPPTGPTTPKARKPSHRLYRQFHRDEHQIVFHLHFDVEQYLRSPHRCDTVLVYTDHAGIDLVGSELDPNLRQFVDHALAPPVDAHQYPHMVGIIKGQRGKVSLAMYNRSPVPLALGHQPIDDRQRATSAPPPLPPPMRSSSLSQDDAEDETPQTAATVAAALARASRLFGSSPVGPAYLGNPINRVDSGRASAISTRHNSFVVHDEDPSAEVDTVEPTGEAPVAGNPDGSFEHTTSASAASASAGEQGWVRAPKWVSSLADFEREFLEELLWCKSDLLRSMAHLPTQQLYNQLFLESLFGLHLTPVQSYAYTAYTPMKRTTAAPFAVASPGGYGHPGYPVTPTSSAFVHRSPSTGSITQPVTPTSGTGHLRTPQHASPHTTPGGTVISSAAAPASMAGAGAVFAMDGDSPPGSTGILRRARNWTSRLVKSKKSIVALNVQATTSAMSSASSASFAMANEGHQVGIAAAAAAAAAANSPQGHGKRNAVSIDGSALRGGHLGAGALPTTPGRDLGFIKPTSLGVVSSPSGPASSAPTMAGTTVTGSTLGGVSYAGKPPPTPFAARNSFASISATALAGDTSDQTIVTRTSMYTAGGNGSVTGHGRPLSIFGTGSHSIFSPLQSHQGGYFSILGKYKIKTGGGTSRRNFTERRPKSMAFAGAEGVHLAPQPSHHHGGPPPASRPPGLGNHRPTNNNLPTTSSRLSTTTPIDTRPRGQRPVSYYLPNESAPTVASYGTGSPGPTSTTTTTTTLPSGNHGSAHQVRADARRYTNPPNLTAPPSVTKPQLPDITSSPLNLSLEFMNSSTTSSPLAASYRSPHT